MLAKAAAALAFLVSASTGVTAADSDWQDLGGGKVRLLAVLDPQTSVVSAAVEVQLKPGWTTYWRYPGRAGIPPRFDFSASNGFQAQPVQFPTPTVVTGEYGSYAGYKDRVLFPFEGKLLADGDGALKLDLRIGVCEEICIPARASMKIDTASLMRSDPRTSQTIKLAKFTLPRKLPYDDLVRDITRKDANTLRVAIAHKKRYGKPALLVEGPADWHLQPGRLVSQNEDTAWFDLDVSSAPKDADPDSHEMRYTLIFGNSGFETASGK